MDINFGVVVRLERKFRPPKLVRAAAYEAWARRLSANFGRPGVRVPRAADDEMRMRPRPQKSDYEINACSR